MRGLAANSISRVFLTRGKEIDEEVLNRMDSIGFRHKNMPVESAVELKELHCWFVFQHCSKCMFWIKHDRPVSGPTDHRSKYPTITHIMKTSQSNQQNRKWIASCHIVYVSLYGLMIFQAADWFRDIYLHPSVPWHAVSILQHNYVYSYYLPHMQGLVRG